jgi:hypothetical protein
LAALPEVEATVLQGFRGLISLTSTGMDRGARRRIFKDCRTAGEIVARLVAALNATLADAKLRRKLGEAASMPPSAPAQTASAPWCWGTTRVRRQ